MTHSVSRRNPYIIGRPIDDPKQLFGRQDLFCFLEDNLSHGVKVTLLHGQRRIGKSSIIRNIPKFVKLNDFAFISFNLEDYTRDNLSKILAELAKEIIEHLELDAKKIKPPSIQDLEKDAYIFYGQFLTKVYDELDGKKIAFLLDEFEALVDKYSASLLEEFFNYLHSIIAVEDRLFLIMFAGRESANMPNLISYFPDASTREIGFLNEDSATQLITQPAQGILEYEPKAIQAIIELSAGHPYFIQVICFAIFVRARELDEWHIKLENVDNIVDKAIENAEAGLAWFWDGLTIAEKVVFSAVAESQKIAIEESKTVPENAFKLLEKYGFLKTEALEKAIKELVVYKFLDDTGNKIKIELVRRWLLQRHPLRQEIKELEKLNEEDNYLSYEAKEELLTQKKKQNHLANYQTNFAQNYNNFSSVLTLNEKKYDSALTVYGHGQADQVDPKRNKLLARDSTGLWAQQKKLDEISEQEEQYSSISDKKYLYPPTPRSSKIIRRVRILAVVAVIGAFAGIGISRLSTPCSGSENKVLGVCVNDPSINISSGDRTFFPITPNTYRDQGIQTFKKGDYQAAVQLFGQAVAANHTDPEVLIYYNNARANQKGNPFTLAVVVPAIVPADNNPDAQEILRGVAQAQHQFNQKNGLNGRLLEIKIANDAGEPEQAKQVAAELVKNQSVLGIIGHNSSEVTKAALTEYQKAGIPVISPTSTSTSLQSNVFFRSVPLDAVMGRKLALYAFNNLNLKTTVIFFNPNNLFSENTTDEFKKNFEELGGKIIREIDLTDNRLHVEKEINTSLDNQAQAAVLIPDRQYTDVTLDIAKANNSSNNREGGKLKLLSAKTLYNGETLTKGGNAVEGLITVVPWFREAAQAKNFAQKAKKLWTVDVGWRTATSYDATQAFIQALSANSDRTTILEKLENANFSVNETSGYPLKFSREGERQTEPILVQIKRGKWVEIQQ
jgi:ABC-type branched-subunit amino acid transport system substrate-binding protein